MIKQMSLAFDTIKLKMLADFAKDINIPNADLATAYVILANNSLNTFRYDIKFVKLRIAWSLIKVGVFYTNHSFLWRKDGIVYTENLETMLNIVFLPIANYFHGD